MDTFSPKKINHIYTENGMAYLSTSFGVAVLNLSKKETKETYSFIISGQSIEVREFTSSADHFFAATANGLYRAKKTTINLQDFSAWQKLNSHTNLISLVSYNNNIYAATKDSMFLLSGDTLSFVYKTPYSINRLNVSDGGILINEFIAQNYNGRVKLFNTSAGQVTDSFNVRGNPVNTVKLSDGSFWVADNVYGLGERNADNELDLIHPDGPASAGNFDILPYNGDVWVAHGGFDENWTYIYNRSGISHYKDGKWTTYNDQTRPEFNNVTDIITLAKDPVDGTIYAGSYKDGLMILKPDGSIQHEKQNSPWVENHYIDQGSYRIAGLTFDLNGNLWINNAGAVHELTVKTPEGNLYKYSGGGTRTYSAYIVADDNNLKWYILPGGADGIAAYDDNNTPENGNDDKFIRISASQYGLNSFINCIAKDKQNAIWIGTNDGIGILNCSPDQVFSGDCEIRRPIVQYDQFAGYLFQNEKVRTIAVDGANRKWIGTTNGVWLISPDGDKIIYRFTADNSPLPANDVRKIAVDPITGDVYIGTNAGLVSYRSTATEGGQSNESVLTFPNPVPPGYSGTIAIRGLVENADVRITDISGQLVYRTRALGGQAVWNGLDYTGRRPQSGVYLIFVTNKDGSQTHAGKMVFME